MLIFNNNIYWQLVSLGTHGYVNGTLWVIIKSVEENEIRCFMTMHVSDMMYKGLVSAWCPLVKENVFVAFILDNIFPEQQHSWDIISY